VNVVYVIGAPGAGKTTMVTGALALLNTDPIPLTQPIPHVRYGDIWHLGHHRQPFGGTDSLSMSIQPVAVQWLHTMNQAHAEHPRVLLAEGDRLANNSFFTAVETCGHHLTVIHLDAPPTLARQRSETRSPQTYTWWKGRYTKVTNLANSRRTIRLHAAGDPAILAANLHHLITQPSSPHQRSTT
jgi:hypothetical protein